MTESGCSICLNSRSLHCNITLMPDMLKDEAEAQKLLQGLHQRIDRLPASSLVAADRLLLKIEVDQLRQQLVSIALAYQVSAWRKHDTVTERAERGSWDKFDRAISKVRDVPPLPGDEKSEEI